MQVAPALLFAIILALLRPLPIYARWGLRLVFGTAIIALVFLERPSPITAVYLAIPGFLLGVAFGGPWLDRLTRGSCAAAAVLLFPQILHHFPIQPATEPSMWLTLLEQAASSFVVGTLLQAATGEEIPFWRNRLSAILKTQTACWALAAVIQAI